MYFSLLFVVQLKYGLNTSKKQKRSVRHEQRTRTEYHIRENKFQWWNVHRTCERKETDGFFMCRQTYRTARYVGPVVRCLRFISIHIACRIAPTNPNRFNIENDNGDDDDGSTNRLRSAHCALSSTYVLNVCAVSRRAVPFISFNRIQHSIFSISSTFSFSYQYTHS